MFLNPNIVENTFCTLSNLLISYLINLSFLFVSLDLSKFLKVSKYKSWNLSVLNICQSLILLYSTLFLWSSFRQRNNLKPRDQGWGWGWSRRLGHFMKSIQSLRPRKYCLSFSFQCNIYIYDLENNIWKSNNNVQRKNYCWKTDNRGKYEFIVVIMW